jgi:hypothetical protein
MKPITVEFLEEIGFVSCPNIMGAFRILQEREDDYAGQYVRIICIQRNHWACEIWGQDKEVFDSGAGFGHFSTQAEILCLCSLMGLDVSRKQVEVVPG